MNKTCLQCGSILPQISGSAFTDPELGRVRVCSFCDSHLPADNSPGETPPQQFRGKLTDEGSADSVWRGEVSSRVASYRARRRRNSPNESQPHLPFEQPAPTPPISSAVVVADRPVVGDDDFSFTIAIGRTANHRRNSGEAQMYIDVSVPPGQSAAPEFSQLPSETAAAEHSGLYPVANIDERRLAGLIDAACLLFACGGFLALFGSLGGHFAFSKLSAAVYAASFAIVYLQYFSLFTVFGGTTPGMMLRGLRVVDFSGEDPTQRQFLLRAAGYMLSAGTFFLGFLWSQWDEDELTWHDRISSTYLSSASNIAESEFSGAAHTH